MWALLLLTPMLLWGSQPQEKRIEYIGFSDGDRLEELLSQDGSSTKVVNTDWKKFSQPFQKNKSFIAKLKQKIAPTTSIELDPLISKVVFMNIPNHFYRDFHLKALPKEKLVLFMWEPIMHARKMYNTNLHACFSRVYTWDDDLVDNVHYFKFYYPNLTPMIEDVPAFEDKKLCTLVSGYHDGKDFPRKYPNELYSERKKAVAFFEALLETKGEQGFDLYGRGWDVNKNPSYKGPIKDKISVIKNYRFSICYENCQFTKGYITEKIFDCFAAASVPIYWGPPNITDYIPKECFIDRRDFATLDELYTFMKEMTKEEYEHYLDAIRTFLKSDKAQLFSRESYEQLLLEAVKP